MEKSKVSFSDKQLAALIIPVVISTFLNCSVGIVDTMMISSLDKSCISGVSLVNQITVLIINIFAALATGGAVVTSQLIGAKKDEQARESSKQLIISGTVLSAIVSVALVVFSSQVIKACFPSLDDLTSKAAITYLFITGFSFVFIAIENCCGALFRCYEKSQYCMYSSLICNIVNVVGNALTIYVLKWGVEGAAISTTLARFVGMLLMLVWISAKNSPVRITLKSGFKPNFAMIRRILKIGIPNGLENGIFQLGRLMVVGIISNYGTVQMTANAVADNLDTFGCIFGQSMNLVVITVIGQCVGAHDFDGVRFYAKKLLAIQYCIGSLFYLSTLVLIEPILFLYNLDEPTAALAKTLVFMHNGVGMFIWPLAFTVPNLLRAANDVRFSMLVSVISMITCGLLLSYVLHYTLSLGAIGVFTGMLVDWVCRLSFFCTRFLKGGWKKYCT